MGAAALSPCQLPARIAVRIIVAPDGCWIWQCKSAFRGYGQVHYVLDGKRSWGAHRLVYRLLIGGPMPEQLHHTCPRKLCVNPAHLEPLTRREHQREHRIKDVCDYGHPYSGDNVYIRKDGGRQCRACKARIERERAQRRGKVWRQEQNRKRTDRRKRAAGVCACGTPLGSPDATRCRPCASKHRWGRD